MMRAHYSRPGSGDGGIYRSLHTHDDLVHHYQRLGIAGHGAVLSGVVFMGMIVAFIRSLKYYINTSTCSNNNP